jgi:hypothetical protein
MTDFITTARGITARRIRGSWVKQSIVSNLHALDLVAALLEAFAARSRGRRSWTPPRFPETGLTNSGEALD